MDQFISDIAAKTGVDPSVARKAVAIIISFLSREGPPDSISVLMDKLPGAKELAAEAGGGGSGIMGVFNDLTGVGLGLGAIQDLTRGFVDHARASAGDKEVDAVIASIPGLGQFV